METIKTENVNIEEIVKKPRKPRMSNIVSKAVLLKQISDADIVVASLDREVDPPVIEKTPTTVIPELRTERETPKEVRKTRVKASKITPISIPLDPVSPTPTPPVSPTPPKLVKDVCEAGSFIGHCDLCSVSFKSSVLFARHSNTLKHKLAKNKADHIKKESK